MGEAIKLKPCPFCGCEFITSEGSVVDGQMHCDDCGCYGPHPSMDMLDITPTWNTRTAVNNHQKLVEALEKATAELEEAADKFWVIHCNHPGKSVSKYQEQDKQFLATLSERMTGAAASAKTALSSAKGDSNA